VTGATPTSLHQLPAWVNVTATSGVAALFTAHVARQNWTSPVFPGDDLHSADSDSI